MSAYIWKVSLSRNDLQKSGRKARRPPRHTGNVVMTPDWSRLLIMPIHLTDGTILRTLGDAADRIVNLPPSPSAQVAAERIIDAATKGGDMFATHAAIRLALLKGSAPKT